MTFKLEYVEYHFDIEGAGDFTRTDDGEPVITVRPRCVILYSEDGGKTISSGVVEGQLVRKTDGGLGNRRRVGVGPRYQPAPPYVNEMLGSLGMTWSGGA